MIRILYTSDVHGYIVPYSYADGRAKQQGFARLAHMIRALRDEDTVVIDGGDTIDGSPLTFRHRLNEEGHESPVTTVMRAIGYDYINLGNHDFSQGLPALRMHLDGVRAKCLTGNIHAASPGKEAGAGSAVNTASGEAAGTGKAEAVYADGGRPWDVRILDGRKVGFTAVTNQCTQDWEKAENVEGLVFEDAFLSLREQVRALRELEHPDYIVAVYHGGFLFDPETRKSISQNTAENQANRMLEEIPGIDVLLTGHQHTSMLGTFRKTDGRSAVYIQPGVNGAFLAEILIDPAEDTLGARLHPADAEPDPEILSLTAKEEAKCLRWLDEPIGACLTDLSVSDEFKARRDKAQLATFLNLVQLAETGAELSASAIFPGATGFGREVTMRQLVSTYMFPNTLVVKRISGAALRAYLEKTAEYFVLTPDGQPGENPAWLDPPKGFDYDMVDGVEYTIDVRRPPGERIISLTRNGRPVEDGDSFTIALNNYRAAGGGNYPMLRNAPTESEHLTDMTELIASYLIRHNPVIFASVHNIRVLPSGAEGRNL